MLPADICQLTDLAIIHLAQQRISGGFLPAVRAACSNADTTCYLAGCIPSTLGRLTGLTELWLSNNSLTGTGKMTCVRKLSGTRLDTGVSGAPGSIPESIGNLSALHYLILHSNRLTGPPRWRCRRVHRLSRFVVKGLIGVCVLCVRHNNRRQHPN